MTTLVIFLFFFSLYIFATLIMVYSSYEIYINYIGFDELKEPSIYDLSEEERTNCYTVDKYIKETICQRYYQKKLHKEINEYQQDAPFLMYIAHSVFTISLTGWHLTKIQVINKDISFLYFVIALALGTLCYFVVKTIYCKHTRYYAYKDGYPLHDCKSHSYFLLNIKKDVVFRYVMRNVILTLVFILFIIVSLIIPDAY